MRTTTIVASYSLDEATYRAEVARTTGPVARERTEELRVADLAPEARLALLDLRASYGGETSVDSGTFVAADQEHVQLAIGERAEPPVAADASHAILDLLAAQRASSRGVVAAILANCNPDRLNPYDHDRAATRLAVLPPAEREPLAAQLAALAAATNARQDRESAETATRAAKIQAAARDRAAAAAAEAEASERARSETRSRWIEESATDEQRERDDAGLLPDSEVEARLQTLWWAPLDAEERYKPLTSSDLAHNEECEDHSAACYESHKATYATPEEFARLKRVRALAPVGSTVTLRTHVGTCDCGETADRTGVLVVLDRGGFVFRREFAV